MNNETELQRRYDEMPHASLRVTLPPLPEGSDSWKLYGEYQSPIGRDPWPWHHKLIWRVLMFWHDRAERVWHGLWDTAQPFKEPPMRYETKYHEIKVNPR